MADLQPHSVSKGHVADGTVSVPLFRHVMACLDRAPQAMQILHEASALASLFGADVTAIRVLPGRPSNSPCADPVDWELTRREEIADLRRLAEAAGAPLGMAAIVACGSPMACVEQEAHRRGVDLLALGAGAFGASHRWGLGGTARHLTETFHGSVLIVPEEAAGDLPRKRRILVPMDGSPSAEAALRYATAIARSRDAELVVLHAVSLSGLFGLGDAGQGTGSPWREVRQEADRLAADRIRRLRRLLPLDGKNNRVRRLDDDEPRRALMKAICEERGELVVLSARGLGQDPDLPVGSTADYLLSRAVTPVLLIRNTEPSSHRSTRQAPRRLAETWRAR
ncbi:universal stress protein [Paracoccus benzoatiresistens]|uniref:Universal stress protein n=1 Tax=Paracoccus benzoatiresistens TaxID=2997341 RepID=A0ABT4JAZ5_9RHOB|nr:universal stress protein [Paracoccus sp. EF6]MCZ0964294.1 universal stress protein [Paracoccus sp. EF6]